MARIIRSGGSGKCGLMGASSERGGNLSDLGLTLFYPGAVDANGDIIWGDKLMILFSRALLEKNPGAAILGEVKCSQTLYDDIAKHGGRPIIWKTGHSLVKAKLRETGAPIAGHSSVSMACR